VNKIGLAGRPVCITGASSGIGRATALACARAGMPVAASARREELLDELVGEIRAAGGRAEAVVADVAEEGSGEAVARACERAFGPPYAVFANAGYGYEAAHHETDPSTVRAIFETNVFGTLRLIDAALPGMLERGAGHVLVCSSCLSALPTPFYGAYSATKSAQHHLASAMRVELRDRGVFVSTVHPVGTRTAFFEEAARRSESPRFLRAGRDGPFMQSPERVARAVVRCLERPRAEVWTSLAARLSLNLSAVAPGLRDRAFRAVIRRREKRGGR